MASKLTEIARVSWIKEAQQFAPEAQAEKTHATQPKPQSRQKRVGYLKMQTEKLNGRRVS